MSAEDFLSPASRHPLVVPCMLCPCYLAPSGNGVVQISTRTTAGAWVVEYVCPACADKRDANA